MINIIPENELEMLEVVGSGGFGKVNHAVLNKKSGSPIKVAVKQLHLAKGKENEEKENDAGLVVDEVTGFITLREELHVLSLAQHPNVVGLVGWCIKEGNMCMVMEYVEGGGLDEHVMDPFKLEKSLVFLPLDISSFFGLFLVPLIFLPPKIGWGASWVAFTLQIQNPLGQILTN